MKNRLFTDAVIYGISGSFVAVIPLLLLPYMTRVLTQSEYGLALFFSAIVTMLVPLIGFGSINAIGVRYFQLESKTFASYLWSCIFVLVCSCLIIFIILIIVSPWLIDVSIIPLKWVFIAVLTTSFWGISQACGIFLIAKQRPDMYLFINATIGCVTVLFTFFSISYFGFSWQGFAWALFWGHLLAAVLSLLILKSESELAGVKIEHCKDSLKFGAPIVFHSIAMSAIGYFDRVIISNFLGLEEMGRYAVAFQLAIVLNFGAQAFNKAFVPWLFGNLKSNSAIAKVKIVRGTYLIFMGIILSTTLFSFVLEFLIIQFAGQQYADMYFIAIIIAVGGAFNAAYLMVINYVFYAGKTVKLSILTVSVAIFFIGLSSFMVPRFGLYGASFSFASANFLLFASVWYLAAKSYSMPWFSSKIFQRSSN